ncbi:E3 ubiquitin-protein ligase TRIM7 isoform X2 [Anolis carolinensis]
MSKVFGMNDWFEATCFLCHEYFIDPVTLDCEHHFCHSCILHAWRESKTETLCPRCKKPALRENLKPHADLAKAVKMVKWVCQEGTEIAEGGKICKEHRQAVKYFCKDHLLSFCPECEKTKDHLAHNAVPASEAANDYKDEIANRIDELLKEEEDIEMHKSLMEKQWQDVMQQVETEKQLMVRCFESIHQRLTELCNNRISKMDNAVEEMQLKKSEHMAELSRERTKTQDFIWDLRKKHQQRTLDFLQTIGSTMEKCEMKKMANLVPFPTVVKTPIWELQDFVSLLPVALKQFEAVLTFEDLEGRDQEAVCPNLILAGALQALPEI